MRAAVPGIIVAFVVTLTYEGTKDRLFLNDLDELLQDVKTDLARERSITETSVTSRIPAEQLLDTALKRLYDNSVNLDNLAYTVTT